MGLAKAGGEVPDARPGRVFFQCLAELLKVAQRACCGQVMKQLVRKETQPRPISLIW